MARMREFSSQDLQKKSSLVQEAALVAPIAITFRGRRRHVMMSAEEFERLRRAATPKAYVQHDIPENTLADLADAAITDSGIALASFEIDGRRKTARKPLKFSVQFEPGDQLYLAKGKFGLFAAAKTRNELALDLAASLAMLWREYVRAPADELTSDALNLRKQLIEAFGEDKRAS